MLIVTARQFATIVYVCEAAYPEEACGILLGEVDGDSRIVSSVTGAPNESGGDRRRTFEIAPAAMLKIMREERSGGPQVLGFFHSHPNHPPVPSSTDREAAWPGYSYPILSIVDGRLTTWASWKLAEGGSDYEPEVVKIVS